MSADEWTREVPLTIQELEALRKRVIEEAEKNGWPMPDRFTCDDCVDAAVCNLAFDFYNTNGDCLYDK